VQFHCKAGRNLLSIYNQPDLSRNGQIEEDVPKGEIPVAKQHDDRRTRRTEYSLIHALLELIETKPYDLITVQDIIGQANVGRSTFYAHYQNKDGLLMGGFEHMLDLLVGGIALTTEGRVIFDTTMLFGHARGHREIYRKLVWGSGFKLLMKDGHAALSKKVEDRLSALLPAQHSSSISLPLLAYVTSGALLLMLKWWLDRGMANSPEEMNAFFQQLIMESVRKVFS
jgi:AcrR family transcriptional regulator